MLEDIGLARKYHFSDDFSLIFLDILLRQKFRSDIFCFITQFFIEFADMIERRRVLQGIDMTEKLEPFQNFFCENLTCSYFCVELFCSSFFIERSSVECARTTCENIWLLDMFDRIFDL